jgi:hypothetical protein
LRVRGTDLAPELWADDENCDAPNDLSRCKCVTWNVVKWMTRSEMRELALRSKSKMEKIEWLNEQLRSMTMERLAASSE